MFVATSEEMRRVEQVAMEQLGIPGLILMENAGLKVVEAICQFLQEPKGKRVTLFAGKGNNGGDGFVIARHLLNRGVEVKTILLANPEEYSGDAKLNLEILLQMGHKVFPAINPNSLNVVRVALVYTDLIIDAIYGTGFHGALSEHLGKLVEVINESKKAIIAVDLPSGVDGSTGQVCGPCIKAAQTVALGLPKLGNLLSPGADYGGELIISDISLPPSLYSAQELKYQLSTRELVKTLMPNRAPDAHKGDCGRVLVVGGSEGLTGAPALTSLAALRMGAGLVTLGLPKALNGLMEVKLTEVMTKPLPDTGRRTLSKDALEPILELSEAAGVLAIGPGLAQDQPTVELVQELLPKVRVPMVIDADALNALATKPELLQQLQAPAVLTPHPGEMARLLGTSIAEVQENRLQTAQAAAQAWGVVVVLKGAKTIIACPDGHCFINATGNPGLASGGTGDVLTGVIAGLLGQGLDAAAAAVAGVYLHGLAADYLLPKLGMLGMVAGDLLEALPVVTRDLT